MTFAYIMEAVYNLAPSGNVIRLGFVAQITNISIQNLYHVGILIAYYSGF